LEFHATLHVVEQMCMHMFIQLMQPEPSISVVLFGEPQLLVFPILNQALFIMSYLILLFSVEQMIMLMVLPTARILPEATPAMLSRMQTIMNISLRVLLFKKTPNR